MSRHFLISFIIIVTVFSIHIIHEANGKQIQVSDTNPQLYATKQK